MIKQHRTIWIITGCVAIVAAVILTTRQATAPGRDPNQLRVPLLSEEQARELERATLACLDKDPRAQRVVTRRLVEELALLAEQGAHQTAESYYALGVRLFGQPRTNTALRNAEAAYREAIALRPDWATAYNGLGIVLQSMGRLDEAVQAFEKAIALEPEWSRPHNDLAILYRMSGRLDEAEKEALIALELGPDDVAAHNNYGNLLLEQRRFDEAAAAYHEAIQLDPGHPAPYYNLACLASIRNDPEKALAFLACAIVLDERYRDEAKTERHFGNIRGLPEFARIIAGK